MAKEGEKLLGDTSEFAVLTGRGIGLGRRCCQEIHILSSHNCVLHTCNSTMSSVLATDNHCRGANMLDMRAADIDSLNPFIACHKYQNSKMMRTAQIC